MLQTEGLKEKLAHELAVRLAPSRPQPGKRRSPRGGPSQLLVLGAAFAAGIVLAKWIDWRGRAHRRG